MTCLKDETNYAICYNGELYNTEDIRKELLRRGYTFKGHSDTEVLLASYIEWKEECVDHLNGIYAFAVWDEQKEQVFIARDRLGVKPLFINMIADAYYLVRVKSDIVASRCEGGSNIRRVIRNIRTHRQERLATVFMLV